eukprot:TRINITY_DN2317_c0_g1_i1.p1 TRINITY_DN2317_c0_g1~~TRINITY_DN2317_c0_g1_i1.p1  ORF type:complete len:1020 (+),score=301.73 TRINITY_DN2317_c0_g1_i1:92-3151(+)
MSAPSHEELGLNLKSVTPPPNLKWCSARDVYYCKLVAELTKGGKYVKRAVVLTPDKLFVCDPGGAVIRVLWCTSIVKATTQELEVSKKMGLSREMETHILLTVPSEPDLILDVPREPLDFIRALKEIVRYNGSVLEVQHLHKDDERLVNLANFVPPPGYVDTHTKIKQMNQAAKGGMSAAQVMSRSSKKLRPVVIDSQGKKVRLVLTDVGQMEWWEDETLLAAAVKKLVLTGNVLEVKDTGISCVLPDCSKEVQRSIGLLAAYAKVDTTGLPVPNRRRDGRGYGGGKAVTVITRENEYLSLPEGSISYLVSADYGTAESYEDVLEVVSSMVVGGGIAILVKSDVLGTDPAPGMLKCLTFVYEPVAGGVRDEVSTVSSNRSKGSSYRHDPYKASESDGEIEVVASNASSYSSYAYSTTSSHSSYHHTFSSSTMPFRTYIQEDQPFDLSSPPLASSSESTSGIPPLMQTFDSEGSLSRRSSLSHAPLTYGQPPPSPTVNQLKRHASAASSLPNSDAPPMLLTTDSIGAPHDPCNDSKGHVTPEFTAISTSRPAPPPQMMNMTPQAQWVMQQQQQMMQQQQMHMHHHQHHQMYPQQYVQQVQQHMPQQPVQQPQQQHMPQQPVPQQQQQQQQPGARVPDQRSRGANAKPHVSKGFVEFTDTDGDLVRFKDTGGVIELSVNQNVLGYLKSLDYDAKSGKLNDGIGGCTLPVARRKGLESRLAWLAETSGVAHNIKADGPMLFDIVLGHVGEPLGLSFEVIADGTVRISDVLPNTPCGKAGVVCGVIQTLDGQPVRSGDDLRRIVSAMREAGRSAFQLEVKKRPKEDATRSEVEQAPLQTQAPPGGGKGKKGGKGKNGRQTDALVRLFVLFKHGRRAEYASNERVPLGAHVLVESREGVDLGLVAGARLGGRKDDRYRVQRVAQPSEVAAWKALVADEEQALKAAIQQVQSACVPITLHRCEIQYDRRKSTFHYTGSPTREMLAALSQTCSQVFNCKVVFNNCQPPAGEQGDPIDLSTPAIPVL